MDYKTILVHCNDSARLPRLLEPAMALADLFKAHVIGLSVTPPVSIITAGMPGAPDTIVLDEHCHTYRAQNPLMKAAFGTAAAARSVAAEWREAEAGSGSVAASVLDYARAADLVIAAQAAQGQADSWHMDIADRLALESGRPVLIVPNEGVVQSAGMRIVLAWNARREAARAMFDALPLLRHADSVSLVQVDPSHGEGTDSLAAVSDALDRHGIRVGQDVISSAKGDAGAALLAQCKTASADLLVMGCYGHSRLREIVFGGATRHVLAHMTLPALMSH